MGGFLGRVVTKRGLDNFDGVGDGFVAASETGATVLPAELFAELNRQRDYELTIQKLREDLAAANRTIDRLTDLLQLRVVKVYDPTVDENEGSDLG